VLIVLLAGCGARTGLDVPPPIDAARPDRVDASRPDSVDASRPDDRDAGHRDAGRDASVDAGVPDFGARDAGRCSEEICNRLDDDCDGEVDDGVCTTRATRIGVGGGMARGETACVTTTDARVVCWGSNVTGAVDPARPGGLIPLPRFVEGVSGALDIGVGGYVLCARTAEGATCWGRHVTGARAPSPSTPIAIPAMASATSLAVASSAYCGLVGGGVVCSSNSPGGLYHPHPTYWSVTGITDPVGVSMSPHNAFVLQADGTIVGWGLNYEGELGNGTSAVASDVPIAVVGVDDAIKVCTDGRSACAIRVGGRLSCWGVWPGDGTASTTTLPVDAAIDEVVDVSCGNGHRCAIRRDGSLWCWGWNQEGQLADGTVERRLTPVRVPLDNVVEVAAGYSLTCALLADGTVWCWGNQCSGAIGDGSGGTIFAPGCDAEPRGPTQVLLP